MNERKVIKWSVYAVGMVIVDACCWGLPLPLYAAVQIGTVLVFVSGGL
jgi:hypothetical protein